MCERGNDEAIDVCEDRFHRFAVSGGNGRKLCLEIARLDGSKDRPLVDVGEIIGNPVDQIMPQATKVFRAHVAQLGRKRGVRMIHGGSNLTIGRIGPIGCI